MPGRMPRTTRIFCQLLRSRSSSRQKRWQACSGKENLRFTGDTPNVKQIATAFGENSRQVHDLKTGQRPVQFFVITLAVKHRNNPVLITCLDERIGKLPVHPHGFHRFRRQNNNEPVAALQGRADFPLPAIVGRPANASGYTRPRCRVDEEIRPACRRTCGPHWRGKEKLPSGELVAWVSHSSRGEFKPMFDIIGNLAAGFGNLFAEPHDGEFF